MQKTLRWLESLRQVRYQLIAYDAIGHLLLDLGLNEQAVEQMERGLALGRDAGIMFWHAAIEAHLAIAQSRLGQRGIGPALQAALERSRASSERCLVASCLDALAESALAAGDAPRCRAYADELLALSEPNGMREIEAGARRWRGEALRAERTYAQAQAELSRAAALADEVGRVRLQMDVQAALAGLCRAEGERKAAHLHGAKARAIAEQIEQSLASSGLEARLLMTRARAE